MVRGQVLKARWRYLGRMRQVILSLSDFSHSNSCNIYKAYSLKELESKIGPIIAGAPYIFIETGVHPTLFRQISSSITNPGILGFYFFPQIIIDTHCRPPKNQSHDKFA